MIPSSYPESSGSLASGWLPGKNNRPFSSCFEPHESDARCIVFIMKISFHSYANKTNFRVKSLVVVLRARFFIHNSGIRMVGTECEE